MTSVDLFAGLRVRDFAEARAWYERLLGEPTFLPHATEAVWTAGIAARGLDPYRDPDGNELGIGGAPLQRADQPGIR